MEKVFISWSFWLWSDHTVYIYPYKNCQTISQSCYTIFFTVLGFELRAYTWVTPPALFCDGTGSHKLFAWAGFKLQLSWSLSPEYLRTTGVSHWCLAFLKIHIVCKNSFSPIFSCSFSIVSHSTFWHSFRSAVLWHDSFNLHSHKSEAR
jgi:hypothetical protein